jgi:peptidylprolyl isomerase
MKRLFFAVLLAHCNRGEEPQDIETEPATAGEESRRGADRVASREESRPHTSAPAPERPMPEKPTVTIPNAAPPRTLVSEDITVGDGAEARPGSRVSVHYVGVAWSTKRQFDASYDRGRPFTFPLGAHRVIQGWDEGVAGMRVGGRRRLTIPPEMGYGERGAGDDIKPGETLVFVVDLISVE